MVDIYKIIFKDSGKSDFPIPDDIPDDIEVNESVPSVPMDNILSLLGLAVEARGTENFETIMSGEKRRQFQKLLYFSYEDRILSDINKIQNSFEYRKGLLSNEYQILEVKRDDRSGKIVLRYEKGETLLDPVPFSRCNEYENVKSFYSVGRVCKRCKAKLRRRNPGPLCGPCYRSEEEAEWAGKYLKVLDKLIYDRGLNLTDMYYCNNLFKAGMVDRYRNVLKDGFALKRKLNEILPR